MRLPRRLVIDHEPRNARRVPERVRRALAWGVRTALAGMALTLVLAALPAARDPVEWDSWRPAQADGARDAAMPFPDAMAVGREADGVLFACRAMVKQDMHVGRIRRDFGGCHIGFNGREMEVKSFEVLSLAWKPGDAPVTGALVAGTDWVPGVETPFATASLYVCRAAYQGGVHSGQARAGGKGCSFGYGGKRVVVGNYEVLQAAPWLSWVAATTLNVPDGALVSGNEGGEPFLACRAPDKDGLHPGKVKRGPIGCSIVSNGRELTVDRFEVLVPRWISGHAGTTPVGGFLAGRENGEGQFLCRTIDRDGNREAVQLGKVSETLGGCHVGMRGAETVLANYEVLAQ